MDRFQKNIATIIPFLLGTIIGVLLAICSKL